ncbi:NAD(P)-binding domain-containing protein [Nocardia sp. NPDC050710]|uniref:NAD(P)-binding domain-containing protein n=1 Tax=Nocardia sp. NPDC050710 TaxID=3157220 RepID=UPI0034097036
MTLPKTETDYLIVGAGPAGLQLAYLLEQQQRSYVVLDQGNAPGAFFGTFPRHRTMISINKRHTGTSDPEFNLRMDWNSLLSDDRDLLFTKYSERYFPPADDMVRYLADFASVCGLNIEFGRRVVDIAKEASGFTATDEHGDTYTAARVIIATGVSLPNTPDIPGIELADSYASMSTDPAEYIDKRVLIVGKGNSAFETADNLMESASVVHIAGPNPIKLAWHTHFVGHLRAVNNNFLDTYQLKSQNAILDAKVLGIAEQDDRYDVEFAFSRGSVHIQYDRVIICTGFRFDSSPFHDSCRPQLTIDDRFPLLTPAYESVDVEGLYFAGTLTQSLDFKKGTSGFIHGFRYGARALFRILESRYHGTAWPYREVSLSPAGLTAAILARVNRSSALWQQFGVLADVLTVPVAGMARYYEEIPIGYLDSWGVGNSDDTLVVTLEYGPDAGAPFGGTVVLADAGPISSYLHPVIRRYRSGEIVAEHHIASDLENDWSRSGYADRLRKFLADTAVDRVTA